MRSVEEIANELAQVARDMANTKNLRDVVAAQHEDLDAQLGVLTLRLADLKAELAGS